MKKNYLDLLRLWLRDYFRHPLENLRQARPIVPRRLYNNFGNACKAVPYTAHQRDWINQWSVIDEPPTIAHDPAANLELVRSLRGNREAVRAMEHEFRRTSGIPAKCEFCDFHRYGIPCPIYNELADGSTVCDTYRYTIIKRAPHV